MYYIVSSVSITIVNHVGRAISTHVVLRVVDYVVEVYSSLVGLSSVAIWF